MNIEQIIACLDGLQEVEDEAQLDAMIEAVSQLSDSPRPETAEPLLRIFERFPEEDGYETFWSILHTLERTPDYETKLVESVRRQPNEFNVRMVNRMLNSGVRHIGNTDLLDLLRHAANNERTPTSIKKYAAELGETHRSYAARERIAADSVPPNVDERPCVCE